MRNEVYFENIEKTGDLYLDYIFLEYEYEPIYFTCVDDFDNLYLCLCSEIRGKQRWVISKSDTKILRKLLEQQLDMAEALCCFENVVIVDRDICGDEYSRWVEVDRVDELDLPKAGTMLRCDRESALAYVLDKDLGISFGKQEIYVDYTYDDSVSKKIHISLEYFNTREVEKQFIKRMTAYAVQLMEMRRILQSENISVKSNINQLSIYMEKSDKKDDQAAELENSYLLAA